MKMKYKTEAAVLKDAC